MKLPPSEPRIRTRTRSRPRIRTRNRIGSPYPLSTPAADTFAAPELRELDLSRCWIRPRLLTDLHASEYKLRQCDPKRLVELADRIREHHAPLVIYAFPDGEIAHGENYLEAYRRAGATHALVLELEDRPPAQRHSLAIALDRAATEGKLDEGALKARIEFICIHNPDWLGPTFLPPVEIDFALHSNLGGSDDDDAQPGADDAPVVSRTGDLLRWSFGHRQLCGNSRHPEVISRLMGGASAQAFTADPPYACSVASISDHHAEWKEGSGMSETDAEAFHRDYLAACLPWLDPGSLVYLFMDWKGLYALLTATRAAGLIQKALCTWDKITPSQGGLYRNQAEHIYVGQHGKRPKGQPGPKHRRGRTTVWSVPGYAGFRPDRKQALKDHAATKPQAILLEMLQDATQIGDICLDMFGGTGSIMLAAQRLKRRCYSVEIEERFCDVAVRRMFELTGEYPIEETTGLRFDELACQRGVPLPTHGAPVAANATNGEA